MRLKARRFLEITVFLGIAILLVELISFAFFTLFADRFTFFDPANLALSSGLTEEAREQIDVAFDEYLGWKRDHATPQGERPRPVIYARPLVSTFGDSFTYCDEVKDDETWQSYLSDLLQADVYNFGTSGFGTDQAFLRFLETYPELETPVVTLGLVTESINRIVNVYRPFYYEKTGVRLTKPRFELLDGKLATRSNPIRSVEELALLEDHEFLEGLAAHDWWYNRQDYPLLEFPYTRILFNSRMWLELTYKAGLRPVDDLSPRPWEDLWEVPEVTALMFEIVDTFVEEAERRGARPVVLLLPQGRQVHRAWKRKGLPRAVSTFLLECESRGWLCYDGITALAKTAGSAREAASLIDGHATAEGNRRIAESLLAFLTESLGPPESWD